MSKVMDSIEEALDRVPLHDGMTVSFHHHLRNGDFVLNMVMYELYKRGLKDITVAASSIFQIHQPLVEYMKNGFVTGIITSYMTGPVAEAISKGLLQKPAIMQTHGGRARAIESGEIHIDIAFIAAPTSDEAGNINGAYGPAACGSLGYAAADAKYADYVIAITDNLVPYPACPIEIDETQIDYVVKVDSIGNPEGIVSGTTKITKDPVGLRIAKLASSFIEEAGYIKNGLSFQTGAGGTSLAVAQELRKLMKEKNIVGSFASGGITGYIVDMFDEGLFKNLFDVQCFDLKAVESYRDNPKHMGMTASMYGSPSNKSCIADHLDIMVLGATEVDKNFNVNVITASDGVIMGGSGGHSDTAAGAKLSIVVTNLVKARNAIIKEEVTTITTPGETIDVVVTERGIAINPLRRDLVDKFAESSLPIKTMEELIKEAEKLTGKQKKINFDEKIVALVEYRDGTIIDKVRKVCDINAGI